MPRSNVMTCVRAACKGTMELLRIYMIIFVFGIVGLLTIAVVLGGVIGLSLCNMFVISAMFGSTFDISNLTHDNPPYSLVAAVFIIPVEACIVISLVYCIHKSIRISREQEQFI
jgi:hypothetical protein